MNKADILIHHIPDRHIAGVAEGSVVIKRSRVVLFRLISCQHDSTDRLRVAVFINIRGINEGRGTGDNPAVLGDLMLTVLVGEVLAAAVATPVSTVAFDDQHRRYGGMSGHIMSGGGFLCADCERYNSKHAEYHHKRQQDAHRFFEFTHKGSSFISK